MANLFWHTLAKEVSSFVVKVTAAKSAGTGYFVQVPPGSSADYCVVTALHVIDEADRDGCDIVLYHRSSEQTITIPCAARDVIAARDRDQAIILFKVSSLKSVIHCAGNFPSIDVHYVPGVQVGWVGFPCVAPDDICFFCGYISAYVNNMEAYLVDGVAINGVSGAPVFVQGSDGRAVIVGIVTNYFPNLSKGQPLPGISMIRTINPLMKYYQTQTEKLTQTACIASVSESR